MPKVWECSTSRRGKNVDHFLALAVRAVGDQHYGAPTTGKEKMKFLLVTIDYFTKWVKVEALATITEAKVQNFVWKNIVCRFRIPMMIISGNGRQFDSHRFRSFCSSLGIKNKYSSPGHPQANGQIEVTHRTLLRIIKSWLVGGKGSMAQGITKCPVGLQDDGTNTNIRNTIQPNVRHRSSHPG